MGPINTLELYEIPIPNLYRPVAVDVDPVDRKLYWTDVERRTITRADLDGANDEILVNFLQGKWTYLIKYWHCAIPFGYYSYWPTSLSPFF